MNELFSGPSYFFRGFKYLWHKDIRWFVIIPLLINILLFSALISVGIHELDKFNTWVTDFLPSWLSWLYWVIWPMFFIAGLVILVYSFTFIANLIGAPFNGFLSERMELLLTGKEPPTENAFKAILREVPYALKQQLRLLGYYLPRAAICLILFLIPVVQLIAAPLWLILGAWMMAIQYLSYPFENQHMHFADIRKRIAERRSLNIGFGGMVTIASMIPLLNLLVMPTAVISATILYVENLRTEAESG